MSMLGMQVNELREAARNIQGNLGRCLYRRKDIDEMRKVSELLFEAADTIESLRDRLQDGGIVEGYEHWTRESRWAAMFGTPERAAQTLTVGNRHADCSECVIREACHSSDIGCLVEEPDMLLDWLKGVDE